ncbi:oligosaccharide flippase family protein [Alkalinema pantanalense CENA528]|uniref:oligosaccharide flippase family protein n=1 Tax=Alkalinema pantanalense TaxID=1620705 RepID=UPI003D6FF577
MSKLSLQLLRGRFQTFFQNSSNLRKVAIQGAVWSIAIYGLSIVVRLGSSLVMTRLLSPEIFGLMNLVYIVMNGLYLFSDIGSGPMIVRHEKGDDPKLLNTVWTAQVIRGVIVWLGCLAFALPAVQFYNEPRLMWLLPIVGVSCIISSFHSTSIFTLTRNLDPKSFSFFELKNQLVSTAITIAIAIFFRNIWALVISYLVGQTIQAVWSHFLIPKYRNRFAWDKGYAKEFFHFGRWILISTMLTFLAGQIDRILSGKLISWHFLGVYGVAVAISDLPRNIVALLADRVLFPAVSQLIDLPRPELHHKLLKNRQSVLLAIAAGLGFFVAFGDLPISIMYDQRYGDGTWMLPLLALGLWPNILFQTTYPILFALGKPQYQTFGNAGKLLWTSLGIPFAYSHLGVLGVILVIMLNDIPLYCVISYGMFQEKLNTLKQDIVTTLLFLAGITGMVLIRYSLGFSWPLHKLWMP